MNILHPTDFSQTASHALAFARILRALTGGSLHLVHVQERFDLPTDVQIPRTDRRDPVIEKHLEQLREQDVQLRQGMLKTLTGLGETNELMWGQPIRELLNIQQRYDLIVMGTDGYSRIDSFFLGSVASRLLRRATTPVAFVRNKPRTEVLTRIAVAIDFTDTAQHALAFAKEFQLPLVLIHIITHARDSADPLYVQDVSQRLRELAGGTEVRIMLNRGNPIVRIPELAQESGAGMLVLGMRHARQGLGLRLGARVDGIVRSSEIPVLAVPFRE